ncbi:MAG: hypothetical protein O0X49_05645 [Methanocorpusculum sp.]|nr:hypothetical protein [Methanocorpusculum sp.]
MNKIQTARLSIILLSLIYFLPVLTVLLMLNSVPFQELPALIYLVLLAIVLLPILSAAGTCLYVKTCRPRRKIILIAVVAVFFAVLFLIYVLLTGGKVSAIISSATLFLVFLYPVLMLFFVPAWFTIPGLDKPARIPQILGILTPVFGILFTYFYFQVPDCPVGETIPAFAVAAVPVFFFAAAAAGILAGILLLIRGGTCPEISSPSSSERTP